MATPQDDEQDDRQNPERKFLCGPKVSPPVPIPEDTIKSMIRLGQILRRIHFRILAKGKLNNITNGQQNSKNN